MANGNGTNGRTMLRTAVIVAGFVLTVFLSYGSAMLTFGQDRAKVEAALQANCSNIMANGIDIEANTMAVRNLEISQATIANDLEHLKEQNNNIEKKLDRLLQRVE